MSISQATGIGMLGNAVQNAGAIGIGPYQNASTMQYQASTQPQWSFNLVKNQNGFILHFGQKSWICKDMEEVQQNFMAAMVTERIEK